MFVITGANHQINKWPIEIHEKSQKELSFNQSFEYFLSMSVFKKMKFSLKLYFLIDIAFSFWIALFLFSDLDVHCVTTSEQWNLSRTFLPIAIDHDHYFIVDWVMLVSFPHKNHFHRGLKIGWAMALFPQLRTITSTWGDLVLCALTTMVIDKLEITYSVDKWPCLSTTNAIFVHKLQWPQSKWDRPCSNMHGRYLWVIRKSIHIKIINRFLHRV